MTLKDKVIVITGASKGLGNALALNFAENGAKLVLGYRNGKKMRSTIGKILAITNNKTNAKYFFTDVTFENHLEELANYALNTFGQIDVWINNAGIWYKSPVTEIEESKMEQVFETNTYGTIRGSKAALKKMTNQGFGHIINIVSTSGKTGKPNESVYCGSKFAVAGFTQALAKEVKENGILVTAIFPGGMKTGLFKDYTVDTSTFLNPKKVANLIRQVAQYSNANVPAEIDVPRDFNFSIISKLKEDNTFKSTVEAALSKLDNSFDIGRFYEEYSESLAKKHGCENLGEANGIACNQIFVLTVAFDDVVADGTVLELTCGITE